MWNALNYFSEALSHFHQENVIKNILNIPGPDLVTEATAIDSQYLMINV